MTLLADFNKVLARFIPGSKAAKPASRPEATRVATENRDTVRHTMRMRDGFVYWPSRPGFRAQSCSIKDFSVSGASFVLADGLKDETLLSKPMMLYCTVEQREYPCSMTWRKGQLVGVKFDGGPRITARKF